MRKADLAKNHDWFEEDLRWYIDFLSRTIGAQRVIRTKADKVELVEALMLRICALWEAFVEAELIDCLNLDCTKFSEYLKLDLPKHMSRTMCEAVLLGDRYLDFRNVGETKNFAKKALCDDNNPFHLLANSTAKKIDELYVMRNYLSHYSSKSKRALRQMYKSSHNLNKFREPGNFLLAWDKGGFRLVPYIQAFLDASEQMRRIIL